MLSCNAIMSVLLESKEPTLFAQTLFVCFSINICIYKMCALAFLLAQTVLFNCVDMTRIKTIVILQACMMFTGFMICQDPCVTRLAHVCDWDWLWFITNACLVSWRYLVQSRLSCRDHGATENPPLICVCADSSVCYSLLLHVCRQLTPKPPKDYTQSHDAVVDMCMHNIQKTTAAKEAQVWNAPLHKDWWDSPI